VQRQAGRQVDAGRRFADAALLVRDAKDLGQAVLCVMAIGG
jgi:hypothetical protein